MRLLKAVLVALGFLALFVLLCSLMGGIGKIEVVVLGCLCVAAGVVFDRLVNRGR